VLANRKPTALLPRDQHERVFGTHSCAGSGAAGERQVDGRNSKPMTSMDGLLGTLRNQRSMIEFCRGAWIPVRIVSSRLFGA
jgi:hypothetical protein